MDIDGFYIPVLHAIILPYILHILGKYNYRVMCKIV